MTTALQTTATSYQDIFDSINFEKIIDHPNILIAAHFWEPERYQAAKNCYKFMRAIDDLIDNYKTEHITIADQDKAAFEKEVYAWINSLIKAQPDNQMHTELMETVHQFCLPMWPMEAFAKSMIYDIYNDGFPTLQSFIEYAGGASVAPASIFVHLCGLTKKDGRYYPPVFDVKRVSTPCAIFSYLVSILLRFKFYDSFPNPLLYLFGSRI